MSDLAADELYLLRQEMIRVYDVLASERVPDRITIDHDDLERIVTSVQALKGPATAEEIALEVRKALSPLDEARAAQAFSEAAAEIRKAMERLGLVIGGLARSFGGGPPALQNVAVTGDVTIAHGLSPKGYEQITSVAASTALTVPAGATTALIVPEVADIRYRDDGIAPTATVGWPLARDTGMLYAGSLSAIRLIQVQTGCILDVNYYS